MRRRGEGYVGRGCCALCFTPWMCAEPLGRKVRCGCHTPTGAKCRTCPTGLFIILPADSRITEIQNWLAERRRAA